MRKKLWNKDFILMLQGGAVSAVGDILYGVAIGYWVYEKTGSSALMGLMSSISMFMVMFVEPFSATIIDKCSRKAIIVGMDAARGVIMLVVGALAFSEHLSVGVVLAAAFLASLCAVFFNPAVSTLMLDLIPRDDMVRGQSVYSGSQTLLNLVGKALSGALVAFLGVPLVIVFNGVSYLISAVTESFIAVPKTLRQGEAVTAKGVLLDFQAGIRAIFRDPFLTMMIPNVILLNFLGAGPYTLMLPFVLGKGFTVDVYGYLMSAQTGASLICICLLGIVKLSPKTRYRALGVGFCASVFLSVGAYMVDGFWPLGILLALSSFANTLGNSILNASLMLALPEENRGGILGLVSAVCSGSSALSAVVYGVVCEVFPLQAVFIAGSLLSAGPMVWFCLHKRTRVFFETH